jgi:hypothetical protein
MYVRSILYNTQYSQRKSTPSAGCEPTLSATERPHTHVLNRLTTGIIGFKIYKVKRIQCTKLLVTPFLNNKVTKNGILYKSKF